MLYLYIGALAVLGHGNIEVLDVRRDVGDYICQLHFAVAAIAVGEHAYRNVVFPDAIDPASQMIFGAKGGLQEPFRDLTIGKNLLFSALTRGDRRDLARYGRWHHDAFERDRGQRGSGDPSRNGGSAHCLDAAATSRRAQASIQRAARVPSLRGFSSS